VFAAVKVRRRPGEGTLAGMERVVAEHSAGTAIRPRPVFGSGGAGVGCLLAIFVAINLAAAVGRAAEPSDSAENDGGSVGKNRSASREVREVGPEVYYLENDAGRLVPVPGFLYSDFVELLRLRDGLPAAPEPPAAVLERLKLRITGEAAGTEVGEAADRAESAAESLPPPRTAQPPTLDTRSIRVELTVVQSKPGWVSLPLGLGRVLLDGPAEHETLGGDAAGAAGTFLIDRPVGSRGYRGWFEGPAGTRHRVVLVGRVRLEPAGESREIGLDLPPANTSSLVWTTPLAAPVVVVQPASLPPKIEPGEDGGSRVTVVGLSGEVRVRLGTAEPVGQPAAVVPQAETDIAVAIDGRKARAEASIRLEGLPANRDRITIRLPRRSTLERVAPPSTVVRGSQAGGDVEIAVERDELGRGRVDLVCEMPVEPSGGPVEPLAFEILEIPRWRQWGTVSLVVLGDWQVEWETIGPLRRIDPPRRLRREGCVAAFAFDAQPARLPLQVRPLASRVVVEPEYRYRVAAVRIDLVARLRVAVRGAPTSQLQLQLDGWEVGEVGPPGLVDSAGVRSTAGGVEIPFLQGLTGDAVIELRATRRLDRDADQVAWDFPRPAADLVAPATVLITAESNIELTPETGSVRGLTRQIAAVPYRDPVTTAPVTDRPLGDATETEKPPPSGRDEPTPVVSDSGQLPQLAYRLDSPEGRFVASRRYLPRRVDASVATRLALAEDTINVEETLRFQVAHLPLEVVELSLPSAVIESESVEIRQDGQLLVALTPARDEPPIAPLPPDEFPEDGGLESEQPAGDAKELPPRSVVPVLLPVPLLGSGELRISYTLPFEPPPAETTLAATVPLVMPLGVRLGKQSVAIETDRGLSVEVRGDSWRRDTLGQSSGLPRSWTTQRPQPAVQLAVATERQTLGETIVEAALLRTRLAAAVREDEFRYRVVSSADRLLLQFDEDVDPASIDCLLDGRIVADAVQPRGRIVIPLPAAGGLRDYQVELIRRGDPPPAAGPLTLAAPRFSEGVVERRFYWDVQLRPDEHLLASPRQWTPQQRWAWGRFGFSPEPIISSAMLSEWIGSPRPLAAAAEEPPVSASLPAADPHVVFSGVGSPGSGTIWLLPTWLLVLVASGPTLLLGLLLVEWPAVRRPMVVMAAMLAGGMAAAVFPDRAVLVAQAALPGAVLAVLAAGLRFSLDPDLPGRLAGEPPVSVPTSSTRLATPAIAAASRLSERRQGERSAS